MTTADRAIGRLPKVALHDHLDGGPDHAVFHFGDFLLNPRSRTLRTSGGEPIALTTGEYELLHILVGHPNRVLSRDELMEHIHGRSAGPFDRAIDVQVSRLRKLIEPDPATPRYLQTVWGFGYVFVPDGKEK